MSKWDFTYSTLDDEDETITTGVVSGKTIHDAYRAVIEKLLADTPDDIDMDETTLTLKVRAPKVRKGVEPEAPTHPIDFDQAEFDDGICMWGECDALSDYVLWGRDDPVNACTAHLAECINHLSLDGTEEVTVEQSWG